MALIRVINSRALSQDSWAASRYVGQLDSALADQALRAQRDIEKARARLARIQHARTENRTFQAKHGVISIG